MLMTNGTQRCHGVGCCFPASNVFWLGFIAVFLGIFRHVPYNRSRPFPFASFPIHGSQPSCHPKLYAKTLTVEKASLNNLRSYVWGTFYLATCFCNEITSEAIQWIRNSYIINKYLKTSGYSTSQLFRMAPGTVVLFPLVIASLVR